MKKPLAIHRPGAIGDVLCILFLAARIIEKYGAFDLFVHRSVHNVLSEFVTTANLGCGFYSDDTYESEHKANYEKTVGIIGYPFKDGKPALMAQHLIWYFADELELPRNAKTAPPTIIMRAPHVNNLPASPYVTMQVKCGWSVLKDWDLANWNALAARIKELSYGVMQIGGKDDPKVEGANHSALGDFEASLLLQGHSVMHLGQDSVFNHSTHIYWTHRNGPVPSVILFGNTSPSGSGYAHNRNLWKGLKCQPCYVDPCANLIHKECLALITVDEVFAAFTEIVTGSVEKPPTLSAAIICKNEAKCIATMLRSIADADEIVVVDTGSQDETLEILAKLKAEELPQLRIEHFQWVDDYSAARNEVLKYVTGDWILSIDCDEELIIGGMARIRESIAHAKGRTLAVTMRGKGTLTELNNPVRLFRKGVKWVGRNQEVPDCNDGERCNVVIDYGYSPAHDLDPDRNLRMLQAAYKENHTCTRTMYYLAREYWYRKQYDKAAALWERYVRLSKFREERADAYLYLARIYWHTQKGDLARSACMNALTINAEFKEALLLMAEMSFPANAKAWLRYAATATNENVLFLR